MRTYEPIPKPGPKPPKASKRLQRTKALKRSGRIARTSKPKPANGERREVKHDINFDGGFREGHDHYVRRAGCIAASAQCHGRIQACHAIARGMGGAKGRWFHLFGGCQFHHGEQERLGNVRFHREYGMNPLVESKRLARRHLEEEMDAA